MATTSTFFKVLLLLNLLVTVHSQQVFADEGQHPEVDEQYRLYLEETEFSDEKPFNYDKNGTDWKAFPNCHNRILEQSPFNISGSDQLWYYEKSKFDFKTHKTITVNQTVNQQVEDWKLQSFSFVTRYRSMNINQSMPVNNVTMLQLDVTDVDTNGLFGFWAAEPFYYDGKPQSHVVQWSFDHMRAHYPSEHKINNLMADLEIQLFHNDLLNLKLACKSEKAAIVLLFNLNSTNDNNGFFDDFTSLQPTPGGDSGSMDISKLLDLASSMKSNISGYVGTDTMPPCTPGVCYYVYEKVFSITQAQLDYFKVAKIPYNARQANQGYGEKYQYTMRNKGFFVE